MHLTEISSISRIKNNDLFNQLLSHWQWGIDQENVQPKKIGNIYGFEILTVYISHYHSLYYALKDASKNQYALFVCFGNFPPSSKNNKCLQETMIGVKRLYRGLGLPVALYSWLILKQNKIIMSDYIQTYGGRSIWEKLAKVPNIYIFGYDVPNKKSFQIDQTDLFNEDIYSEELANERDQLQRDYDDLKKSEDISKQELIKIKRQINNLNSNIRNSDSIRMIAVKK
jgi:hypothetical protein